MALDLERLLDDDRWIRRLARRLVADPGLAEDLAQTTWVAALEQHGGAAPRAWLRRVLTNAWRDRLRVGARREQRERASARPETEDGADALVAELELREKVARALRELPEPQRGTLMRHFLRGESLGAIARADGLAVATVHERVQRGLAELRRRLDAEHAGERRAWALTLAALAERPTLPFGPWELMTMTAGLKTAVAAVTLVGAGAWWWTSARSTQPQRNAALTTEPVALEPGPVALARSTPEAQSARAELLQEPEPAAEVQAELALGRVLDKSGSPVAGVEITLSDREERLTSAPDGSFSFVKGDSLPRLSCDEARHVTLVAGAPHAGEQIVVVAQPADFAGQVVDEQGAPLAGAALTFRLRESLFRTLGMQVARANTSAGWTTTSDARGQFTLAGIAGGAHVGLEVRATGYQPLDFDLPTLSDASLRVVLARDPGALLLSGWVLGPTRQPFAGARVAAGGEFVTTGPDGTFTLSAPPVTGRFVQDENGGWRPEVPARVRLVALAPGFAPAALEFERTEVPAELVLELHGEPLVISGSVRDPTGRALGGVTVWPRDLTPFARVPRGLDGIPEELTVEDELCGNSSSGWFGTVTAEDGSFTLGCLQERTYELEFFEGSTATHLAVPEVAAGTRGLEVVLASETGTRRVAGRVVDSRGAPRGGVGLRPRRTRTDGSWIEPPLLVGGEFECESDGEGRFVFESLATAGTLLDVQAMPPFQIDLSGYADPENLEIVVPILCELQVLLASPGLADSLGVFDSHGVELGVIERLHMDGRSVAFSMGPRAAFTDGRTGVIQVPDTAGSLVLFLGDVRVLERALTLDPQRPTVLRY